MTAEGVIEVRRVGQAAFQMLDHALKILAALAVDSPTRANRLMAEEDLFWAYFSTPGLESSSLLLALVQNNVDRIIKVGPDWINRIFDHVARCGHELRAGWVNLLTALVSTLNPKLSNIHSKPGTLTHYTQAPNHKPLIPDPHLSVLQPLILKIPTPYTLRLHPHPRAGGVRDGGDQGAPAPCCSHAAGFFSFSHTRTHTLSLSLSVCLCLYLSL